MNRALIYLALSAAACGGQALDVGNTDPNGGDGVGGTGATGGSLDPGMPLPEWPAPDACAAMSDLEVVGVWQGFLQDTQFRNLFPIQVEILGASEVGGVCGTLKWGEGELPPPPTDPERGWPEGVEITYSATGLDFQQGAAYTILDGGARGNQVRFRVAATEFWKPWCAIVTSYPHQQSLWWGCLPEHLGATLPEGEPFLVLDMPSGPDIRVEIGKFNLCTGGVCECNQSGCTVSPRGVSTAAGFDLVFEADRATGEVIVGSSPFEVLLHRVE
jgi:hypothetical protein